MVQSGPYSVQIQLIWTETVKESFVSTPQEIQFMLI